LHQAGAEVQTMLDRATADEAVAHDPPEPALVQIDGVEHGLGVAGRLAGRRGGREKVLLAHVLAALGDLLAVRGLHPRDLLVDRDDAATEGVVVADLADAVDVPRRDRLNAGVAALEVRQHRPAHRPADREVEGRRDLLNLHLRRVPDAVARALGPPLVLLGLLLPGDVARETARRSRDADV